MLFGTLKVLAAICGDVRFILCSPVSAIPEIKEDTISWWTGWWVPYPRDHTSKSQIEHFMSNLHDHFHDDIYSFNMVHDSFMIVWMA